MCVSVERAVTFALPSVFALAELSRLRLLKLSRGLFLKQPFSFPTVSPLNSHKADATIASASARYLCEREVIITLGPCVIYNAGAQSSSAPHKNTNENKPETI